MALNPMILRSARACGWGLLVASVAASALSGCGVDDDGVVACNAYWCSTNATLTASVPCREESARFLVTICHGSECSEASVLWVDGSSPVCTGDLVPSDPEGFDEQRAVCASREGDEIVIEGQWDFGREGKPVEKQFSLRISDEASGEVLVNETRSATFEPAQYAYDHCHDCHHASLPLGTSSGSCTPANDDSIDN